MSDGIHTCQSVFVVNCKNFIRLKYPWDSWDSWDSIERKKTKTKLELKLKKTSILELGPRFAQRKTLDGSCMEGTCAPICRTGRNLIMHIIG